MQPLASHARDLLDRVERHLPDLPREEKRMFGTVALMLDGEMLVAAGRDGSLLVRVHRDDDETLLARPDASRPEMGAGRSMGAGWIRVNAAALADDETLRFWLRHALDRRSRG